jgi:hypothetical protein
MAFTPRTETYVNVSSLATPYNFTLNVPSGTADGDIMFTLVCWYNSVTIDSVPGGWTLVGQQTGATTDRCALYYKIAASEPASYTWSLSGTAKVRAVCAVYSAGDFNVASISDITISNTAYRTSDANVRAASMSVPNTNSPMVFFGYVYRTAEATFTKPSAPTTGWVEDDDAGSTTPDFWTTICSFIWSGSGATGNMDAISSSVLTAKHAFAVALKPTSGTTYNESVTLSAAVAVANAVDRILNLTVTLQASGSVGPDPAGSIYNPSMVLSALAAIAPSSEAVLLAGVTLQAAAAQVASGGMNFDGSVVLSAAAVLAAAASLSMDAGLNLQAQAGDSASANALMGAALSLLAGAGITPQAQASMVASTSLDAGAACVNQGQLILDAILALAAGAGATWEGEVVTAGVFYEAIALAAAATLSPQALATLQAIVSMAASSTITPSSTALMEAALTLLMVAEFGTVGEVTPAGGAALEDILITILRRRRNR